MIRLWLAAPVMLLAVAGCQSRAPMPPKAAASSAPAEVLAGAQTPEGPVIVRLVGQHPTITITSSPDGPRYSAREKDGRVIVAGVTLAELQANHPDLAQFVKPGIAVDASADQPSPDALGAYDARR